MVLTLLSVDLETLKRKRLVTFALKGGKMTSKWAPGTKRVRTWLERDGVGTPDGIFRTVDGAKFLKALELSLAQSSTMAIEKG